MSTSSPLTVCILTSGRGTRMGRYSEIVNKALLPVKQKAMISRIIERFPRGTEFVIATGYLEEQVRNFMSLAHPDVPLKFVSVDNFDGPGSGPGYSLLSCEPYLRKPFVFVACDTLWTNEVDFTTPRDWFGVHKAAPEDTPAYCNFELDFGRIVGIRDKQPVSGPNFKSFVGLCRVESHREFWNALRGTSQIAGEHQVSNGIRAIVEMGRAEAVDIDWIDVGDFDKYKAYLSQHENFDFSKSNEFIYIAGRRVIKFFAQKKITEQRVAKAKLNPGVFPEIVAQKDQFYAYDFVDGDTLYENNSPAIFERFLGWLETNLWKPVDVAPERMKALCTKFYVDKTNERIAAYFEKYPVGDGPSIVNGAKIPSTADLLKRVPWERLTDGKSVFFHGDLQFDNVLYDRPTGKFTLLDWRQEFGGEIAFGDLYYDLGKLLGGIMLNYDYVKQNLVQYAESEEGITIDFAQRFGTPGYERVLVNYIESRGLDVAKVRLLRPLIYLNMSPLHHAPFDKMLYSLGRLLLAKELGLG